MGSLSATHWCILAIVAVLLFGGRGRISGLMGDVGKGLRSLKRGLLGEADDTDRLGYLRSTTIEAVAHDTKHQKRGA